MPALPPQAKQTYRIAAPLATHWRPATCAEVGCEHYRDGWRVRVEGLSEADLFAARNSGRRWRELQVAAGETWMVFEAGQPCFRAWRKGQPFLAQHHKVPNDRGEIYLLQPGDWRAYGGRGRRYDRGDQWRDDFAEHQDRLADRFKRG